MEFLEEIKHNDILLALIIRNDFHSDGIHFFTPDESTQQLAYMSHPAGKKIQPHIHNSCERTVYLTKEILFIKSGKLRIDFFSKTKEYLESKTVAAGDIVFFSDGGHGFEILEDIQMFEVKQGPYPGEMDKTRF